MLGVTSRDPVLSMIAPIGLAAAVGTALIVDLGVSTPGPGGRRSLRDIALDGPELAELSPGRSGIALIGAGGLTGSEAVGVIEAIAARWPAVVVGSADSLDSIPVVPVSPIFPGLRPGLPVSSVAVWQPIRGCGEAPGPGPVLPLLRPGLVRQLLAGRLPRMSRWVTAWRKVWEMPWA